MEQLQARQLPVQAVEAATEAATEETTEAATGLAATVTRPVIETSASLNGSNRYESFHSVIGSDLQVKELDSNYVNALPTLNSAHFRVPEIASINAHILSYGQSSPPADRERIRSSHHSNAPAQSPWRPVTISWWPA